jgi:rhodanese-related sulfurtransferase
MKTAADVLKSLDNKMGMISRDVLLEWLESGEQIDIIDLRSIDAWNAAHIKGSLQVLMSYNQKLWMG